GIQPDVDTYPIVLDTNAQDAAALRIEALPQPSLGGNGPGRTPRGNFVLTEVTASAGPKRLGRAESVKFKSAEADFAQSGLPAGNAIDGNVRTGWAIQGPGQWNVNRALTLALERPVRIPGGSRWTIKLDQQFGSSHTLGRF